MFFKNLSPINFLTWILLGDKLWDSCRFVRWVQMNEPTKRERKKTFKMLNPEFH